MHAMRKPVLAASLIIAAALPAVAQERLPGEYLGNWCWVGSDDNDQPPSAVYKRGNCARGRISVSADRYADEQQNCRLLEAHLVGRTGAHRLTLACYSPSPDDGYRDREWWISNFR